MTNVLKFPDRKKELQEEIELVDAEAIEEIDILAEELLSDMVATCIEDLQMDLTGNEYLYDVSYLYECLRSLLMRYHGREHPLQIISQGIYHKIMSPDGVDADQLEFDF
jgi:hypothetical protein